MLPALYIRRRWNSRCCPRKGRVRIALAVTAQGNCKRERQQALGHMNLKTRDHSERLHPKAYRMADAQHMEIAPSSKLRVILVEYRLTGSNDYFGLSLHLNSKKQLQILRRCAPLDDSVVGEHW